MLNAFNRAIIDCSHSFTDVAHLFLLHVLRLRFARPFRHLKFISFVSPSLSPLLTSTSGSTSSTAGGGARLVTSGSKSSSSEYYKGIENIINSRMMQQLTPVRHCCDSTTILCGNAVITGIKYDINRKRLRYNSG